MEAQELTGYLKDPTLLGRQHLAPLGELLGAHPWFTAARILYALTLCREDSPGYPAQLRKTALYVSDRAKLKELVEKYGTRKPAEPVIPVAVAVPPVAEPVPENIPEVIPEPSVTVESSRSTLSKEEIIERFIREEPRISPPRTAFFNPTESSLR